MRKIMMLSTLAGMLVSANALAINANMTFSSTVSASTCTLNTADAIQTITFTNITPNDLLNSQNINIVNFQFRLTGCEPSVTKADIKLEGTTEASDSIYSSVIKNTGTATNAGIGFVGKTSTTTTPAGALPVGETSAPTNIVASTGIITLGAAIVPIAQATMATSGSVTGTATATITYS